MSGLLGDLARAFGSAYGDPVIADLAGYMAREERETAKAAFFENHTWTQLIGKAEMDTDEIIDDLMSGHVEAAQGLVKLAMEKAWEKQMGENERDRYESRIDG
jgi:hypothetical protein